MADRLFMPPASPDAAAVDGIFLGVLLLCALAAGAVLVLIVIFVVRYRAPAQVNRRIDLTGHELLEYAVTAGMLLVFLGMFVAGGIVYFRANDPPVGALQIAVVGKQWMWKLQHPSGRREIDSLTVPLGEPIKLVMTSADVIHSFFLPAFRIKQDVLPARYTVLWFRPTRLGDYPIYCSQYCGTEHARMIGTVHVIPPSAYTAWLASATGADALPMATTGANLFNSLGCAGCHGSGSGVHAPRLDGLWGRPVTLSDGRVIVADDAYLQRSILQPQADVVAGYQPIMPTFQGQITEEQVFQLLAFLKRSGPPAAEAAR